MTWGKYFLPRSYFQIFILQGILLFLVSLPLIAINQAASFEFNTLFLLGITLFLFGFCFESIADHELRLFLQNPNNKGTLMQSGLWKYSRHPNYFGEVVLWWGFGISSLATLEWWGLIGPTVITILILFISGIPLFEKKYSGREDFELYKKKTSIFFPLPPKKR